MSHVQLKAKQWERTLPTLVTPSRLKAMGGDVQTQENEAVNQ